MPELDLSPFLGEETSQPAESNAPTGWSKSPLALEGLRALNADITLDTGLLRVGKVELSDANVVAKLTGGDLKADIGGFNAFGGNWSGDLRLDASQQTPALAINMSGSDVAMQSILSTFANLSTVTGTGGMQFQATSTGNSLHALVNGLNGDLKTNLADGAIKGFNVAQLVRSLDTIQESLLNGSLGFALSPEAETDFTQFDSALTIRNGVAEVDLMRVLNPAVLLDGKGRIDLVNQSIDISITPSVDTRGAGDLDMLKLNGEPFAIPFRLSGSWYGPGVSIDNAAISLQLQSRALGSIGDKITDELGGELGGIVGGVLGVPTPEPDQTGSSEDDAPGPPPTEAEPEDPEQPSNGSGEAEKEPETIEDAVEDAVEDLANDALNNLFGGGD